MLKKMFSVFMVMTAFFMTAISAYGEYNYLDQKDCVWRNYNVSQEQLSVRSCIVKEGSRTVVQMKNHNPYTVCTKFTWYTGMQVEQDQLNPEGLTGYDMEGTSNSWVIQAYKKTGNRCP